MSSRPVKRTISPLAAGLIAVGVVFGFAVLMVLEHYDPAVITTVVTGTSLAAAELVRRLQTPVIQEPPERYRVGRSDRTPTPDEAAAPTRTSSLDHTSVSERSGEDRS
ncbi:hypothetical protein [Embleya sp. NPDC020630]|uniref:hypothetical protein n=1 Tax=Embleya sp. NPDC020630 TaxID=3363979 RepID=UPI0037A64AA6